MKWGSYIRKKQTKGEFDPGHMFVYRKSEKRIQCRGFYFNPLELPKDYQDASSWRKYLFEHKVPGYVKDDIGDLDIMQERPECFLGILIDIDDSLEEKIEKDVIEQKIGHYSFNPDKNHCDNCVTWARKKFNKYAPKCEKLKKIREGRIKEALRELELWQQKKL